MKRSAEQGSIFVLLYRHGFSKENKYEILGESDIKLIQQINGKPQSVVAGAVHNSK